MEKLSICFILFCVWNTQSKVEAFSGYGKSFFVVFSRCHLILSVIFRALVSNMNAICNIILKFKFNFLVYKFCTTILIHSRTYCVVRAPDSHLHNFLRKIFTFNSSLWQSSTEFSSNCFPLLHFSFFTSNQCSRILKFPKFLKYSNFNSPYHFSTSSVTQLKSKKYDLLFCILQLTSILSNQSETCH